MCYALALSACYGLGKQQSSRRASEDGLNKQQAPAYLSCRSPAPLSYLTHAQPPPRLRGLLLASGCSSSSSSWARPCSINGALAMDEQTPCGGCSRADLAYHARFYPLLAFLATTTTVLYPLLLLLLPSLPSARGGCTRCQQRIHNTVRGTMLANNTRSAAEDRRKLNVSQLALANCFIYKISH